MPAKIFRTEIAGQIRVGIECDSQAEFDEFLGRRGIVVLESRTSQAVPVESEAAPRGRPSRDAEISAAIDALATELDDCGSVKAQARLVHQYLETQGLNGEPPPAFSTVENFLAVYRKPRAGPSA